VQGESAGVAGSPAGDADDLGADRAGGGFGLTGRADDARPDEAQHRGGGTEATPCPGFYATVDRSPHHATKSSPTAALNASYALCVDPTPERSDHPELRRPGCAQGQRLLIASGLGEWPVRAFSGRFHTGHSLAEPEEASCRRRTGPPAGRRIYPPLPAAVPKGLSSTAEVLDR